MSAEFIEADGFIHIRSPIQAEYTLCGDAFDICAVDAERDEWSTTTKRTVTCPQCAAVIRECRGVRTARKDAAIEGGGR